MIPRTPFCSFLCQKYMLPNKCTFLAFGQTLCNSSHSFSEIPHIKKLNNSIIIDGTNQIAITIKAHGLTTHMLKILI